MRTLNRAKPLGVGSEARSRHAGTVPVIAVAVVVVAALPLIGGLVWRGSRTQEITVMSVQPHEPDQATLTRMQVELSTISGFGGLRFDGGRLVANFAHRLGPTELSIVERVRGDMPVTVTSTHYPPNVLSAAMRTLTDGRKPQLLVLSSLPEGAGLLVRVAIGTGAKAEAAGTTLLGSLDSPVPIVFEEGAAMIPA